MLTATSSDGDISFGSVVTYGSSSFRGKVYFFFHFFFLNILVHVGSPGWFVDGFRCFSVILAQEFSVVLEGREAPQWS